MNRKIGLSISILAFLSLPVYGGIDWSRYDDPILFLGWDVTFICAIAAIILLIISKSITDASINSEGKIGIVV